MNMQFKRGLILLMTITLVLPVVLAGEDWRTDADRADRYYASGDHDAAWLFFERAMARGADDGLTLFRTAESYRQQSLVDNPEYGADLYAVAHYFLQEQYPDNPALAAAADRMNVDVVVNRRFLRQTYAVAGGPAPKLRSPVGDGLGAAAGFFLGRVGELREFLLVLRSEGLRAGLSWARERAWSLIFSILVVNALTGIILPVVMAVTVAREGRKSYVTSYAFLLHWGFLGIHRFYLGRYISGVIWLLTGGLLGLGLFFDIFLTGAYTRFWNEDHRDLRPSSAGATGRKSESFERLGSRTSGSLKKTRKKRSGRSVRIKTPKAPRKAKPAKSAKPGKMNVNTKSSGAERPTKKKERGAKTGSEIIVDDLSAEYEPQLADSFPEPESDLDSDFGDLPDISFDENDAEGFTFPEESNGKAAPPPPDLSEEFNDDDFDIKSFE